MKIIHVLFDDYPYLDNWGYQENKLCQYELKDGHEVIIVSGKYIPEILSEHVRLDDLKDKEVLTYNGLSYKVYRLKCFWGKYLIGKKIKYFYGLKQILYKEKPDFIFLHDLHSLSLYTITNYVKNNPNIICIADMHVNYVNSARNILSKLIHKIFYRKIIQNNLKYIKVIYYIGENTKKFINEMYALNENSNKLKFLTLGGETINYCNKLIEQKIFKEKNNLDSNAIIFLHSGKMNRLKETIKIIDAFSNINDKRYYLLLIGQPENDIKKEFFEKIKLDKRIKFLGWKSNSELMYYLKISDVYLQPGSPSITAQEAMCKGCATVISEKGNFYNNFVDENSAIYIKNASELYNVFLLISKNILNIEKYKQNGLALAKRKFDYEKQSRELLENNYRGKYY